MSTPFNNQWVLRRARARVRERAAMAGSLEPPADPHERERQWRRESDEPRELREPREPHEPQESPEAGVPPREERRGGHPRSGFGAAFTARAARKRPRWIDRDT